LHLHPAPEENGITCHPFLSVGPGQ
jgi:hypothetical protein